MELGKMNLCKVQKINEKGAELALEDKLVLLPKKNSPKSVREGYEVEVFIYHDNEGHWLATTSKPYAMLHECAYLKVKQETSIGAFMDWGIEKDLFVPFSQQKDRMKEGYSYLVYVYLDEQTNRITGSSKVNQFINNEYVEVKEGEEADLLICEETDLGTKVIVNNKHWGLLFKNEIFKKIKKGERTRGFIKKVREDGKLDVSLQEQGYDEVFSASLKVLKLLKDAGGTVGLTDKSDPEKIYDVLQMSKKTFKKAVGQLYKERKIVIEDNGIKLI